MPGNRIAPALSHENPTESPTSPGCRQGARDSVIVQVYFFQQRQVARPVWKVTVNRIVAEIQLLFVRARVCVREFVCIRERERGSEGAKGDCTSSSVRAERSEVFK